MAASERCRTVTIELSSRPDLRRPVQPHDLNETTRLLFEADRVLYRSDGCEAWFKRASGGQATLLYHVDAGPWFGGAIENLLRLLVANDALQSGGLMLHCGAIVRDDAAVALFGHSGAGKSTTSAMALTRGCSVISDDINLIEPVEGGWQVTPVPFCGTLDVASDIRHPVRLRGLFHLVKAAEDSVRRCSAARAVALLAGSAPFVNGDPYAADQLMAVLEKLVDEVSVHDLHFTPGPLFLERVFKEGT